MRENIPTVAKDAYVTWIKRVSHLLKAPDVLIIGAGPAGLTAAAEAIRHGFGQGPSAGMRAPNVILPSDHAGLSSSLFDLYQGTCYTLMIFAGITDSPDTESLIRLGTTIQAQYRAPIQFYVVDIEPPPHLLDHAHILRDADKSIHRAYASWAPSFYLIRPDKYIAYRSQGIDPDLLARYLDHTLVRNGGHGKE